MMSKNFLKREDCENLQVIYVNFWDNLSTAMAKNSGYIVVHWKQ